ncbi:MAG: hypothetical protein ACRDOO_11570 [Actinomadura sp.]
MALVVEVAESDPDEHAADIRTDRPMVVKTTGFSIICIMYFVDDRT